MKNKLALLSLLLLAGSICMIFGGCKRDSKSEITVGYLPIVAHLPAEIAFQNNYFGERKITFKVYPSSNDLLNDLASGKIDVATTLAIAPLLQYASIEKESGRDIDIKVFSYSQSSSEKPFDGIFVRKDSQLLSPQQLKNKRIGVFPGTTAENLLAYYLLEKYHISRSEVSFIKLPPAAQIDALRNGEIDALFTYETTRTVALLHGYSDISGSVIAAISPNAPYGCSAINNTFMRDNPSLAEAFILGFDKGIDLIRDNPTLARKTLVTNLGIESDVAEKCNLEYRLKSTELEKNKIIFDNFIKLLYDAENLDSKNGIVTSDHLLRND